MTDQLSFDFDALPTSTDEPTTEIGPTAPPASSPIEAAEPSPPIIAPPAARVVSPEPSTPSVASDDASPLRLWPKAPDWTTSLTCPVGDARPRTLRGCVAWLQGEIGAHHPAAKEITGAAHTIIRVGHRVFDLGDKDLPADPPSLRPFLRDAMPAAIKVSRSRFANAKSLVTSLLILTGWVSPHSRSNTPLSPYWAERLAGSRRDLQPGPLHAFFRHCGREGIQPGDIDGNVVERYEAWLTAETLDLRPRHTSNDILTCWRRFKKAKANWPSQPLELVSRRRQCFLPPANFPPSFVTELEAYLAKLRRPGPFDRDYGRPKSEISVNHVRRHAFRAATLLVEQGTPITEITSLAALVQLEPFEAILMALHQEGLLRLKAANEEEAWTRTAYDMAGHLKLMAKRWVQVDTDHLAKLEKLAECVTPPRDDLSERVQTQLSAFRNDDDRKRLYQFPGEAFEMADRMLRDGDTVRAAKLHETAIALMIVLRHVPRRADLAALDLERHLTRDRRGQITESAIRTRKVKGVVLRAEVATDLAARLDRHIRVFRPYIHGHQGSTALFPSPKGSSRGPSTLANQMVRLVARQLGEKFTAHLPRHLAVDIILDDDPNNLALAQRVLGHRDQKTTEKKYGSRQALAAQRKYQKLILEEPGAITPKASRKGRK